MQIIIEENDTYLITNYLLNDINNFTRFQSRFFLIGGLSKFIA